MTLQDNKLKLKKWQRIYVNRSLNMANIRAIGFDMDHTLAIYDRDAFETLAFRKTVEKFIDHGYPQELSQLVFDPEYVIRGLLVDRERGNLLKVDGHKYVKLAFHGHRPLSKEERHALYNSESFKAGNFMSIDSFFSLSEVQLFVEIVDFMAKNPGKITKTYGEVFRDLRHFIDLSHKDGSIKNEVVANPEKFIIKDKNLSEALIRLIESGKELFLLTNSMWDYTEVIMNYVLGQPNGEFASWRDYFSFVIVGAGKPTFFTGTQPFYQVMTKDNLLQLHEGPLANHQVYHGGNAALLQSLMGVHGDQIMYVGDHLYGDIIRSKAKFNWRTMLCVEELHNELPKLEECRELSRSIIQLVVEQESLDEEIQLLSTRIRYNSRNIERLQSQNANGKKRALGLVQDNEKHHSDLEMMLLKREEVQRRLKQLISEKESKIHPVWGELMKVGLEKSRFAQQLEQYSCLYTTRASNLRFYSPFKRFTSALEVLPHDNFLTE